MGWRERLQENAVRLGEGAKKAAAASEQLRDGRLAGLANMLGEDDERALSAEGFLLVFVKAVRRDVRDDDLGAREVYVRARKRRRRLALYSFGVGPFAGVANQLADLYCEVATFCDVASLHGLGLSDEQIGAHMLLLWGVADDHATARGAMAGEPPLTEILTGKLGRQAADYLPSAPTKRAVTKALWDVRGAVGEVRKGATTEALKAAAFTGHRTKKVIKRAEAQLMVGAAAPERTTSNEHGAV